ncbi:MAG TPA: hypothetical protein IAB94_04315 [Candidatus Coproplasma avicola]|uniref:Uncharacterized protein n=1 Tax=Candidatus Coproplasma avicola TaxID=2840744 RepID=A0A9D1J9A1_9FIRM|nr:hypothetical protein [Candidatus Coproplasma avicola]
MSGNNKSKWTKRKTLCTANIIFLLLLIGMKIFCTFTLIEGPLDYIFDYFLVQVAFTIFSLIVYYLSIIADAVSRKKDENDKQNK